jgi:hypothetical protein
MSFRNTITIVASPRTRVGKTLLARLATEYRAREGRAVEAFDLGGGGLAEFLPQYTALSSIGDIKGQMALFDRLIAEDGAAKVVDLGHQTLPGFFAIANKIGFAEEAVRRAIAPAVLFVMTPDATSVEVYRDLQRRFPQAVMVPVHNEIFGPPPSRGRYPLTGGAGVVRLPLLASLLRRYVETPPFGFLRPVGVPDAARDELEQWLRRAFCEFRELDLRLLLADLQSAIAIQS